MSIADIALHCGFATQSHLTATFNRLTNLTPGEYRRAFEPSRHRESRSARTDLMTDREMIQLMRSR